jgi:glutamate-5-semialdehyde dehydrogenase
MIGEQSMLDDMGKRARQAAQSLARADTAQKNAVLTTLAEMLLAQSGMILGANGQDVADSQEAGLEPAMLDRLTLNPARLEGIVSELRQTISLPDPVGEVFDQATLPNGLKIHKRRVPLGVIGVIYEARPNVTVDVASLALKSGNAVILRGGSETLRTNQALVTVIHSALEEHGLPPEAVQFIDSRDRALVLELLQLYEYVDIIIPRGGASLHKFCRENSRIPVITGGTGICHIFVDASADLQAALPVILNAKTQRPSVCNSLDTLLVHREVAADFLPRVVEGLGKVGVTFRADPAALEHLRAYGHGELPASVQPAGPQDFDTEWMSLVLGLKVVEGLDEAIRHTNAHSLGHSDSILTADSGNALTWVNEVDSAAVYVNASTRFTDGNQFGLGAEVAVSTQRLHARGPMALRELTTYKWVAVGNYHIRA